MQKTSYFIFSFVILVLDQLSKWFVTQHIITPKIAEELTSQSFFPWLFSGWGHGLLNDTKNMLLPFTEIHILPFFNIVMVWNHGVSFGLFNNGTNSAAIALSILAVVITIWFTIWLLSVTSRMQAIAIAAVIGGAMGNVIDRIRFGAVIDFLDFHAFGWHYPAFNIADSAVVIGVFILILYAFFFEKRLS